MLIAGVVVLYYPDTEELFKNIQSYIGYLDQLYIIDNTPEIIGYEEQLQQFPASEYIRNGKNTGIAAALNLAAKRAAETGHHWLLTMDQDSLFEQGEIQKYFGYFEHNFYHISGVAIVCPQHSARTGVAIDNDRYQPVVKAITSGSLVNMEICKRLGGYEEKLFIDEVDFDYCYRALMNGYKIFQFDHVYLTHRLGKKKRAGY